MEKFNFPNDEERAWIAITPKDGREYCVFWNTRTAKVKTITERGKELFSDKPVSAASAETEGERLLTKNKMGCLIKRREFNAKIPYIVLEE